MKKNIYHFNYLTEIENIEKDCDDALGLYTLKLNSLAEDISLSREHLMIMNTLADIKDPNREKLSEIKKEEITLFKSVIIKKIKDNEIDNIRYEVVRKNII